MVNKLRTPVIVNKTATIAQNTSLSDAVEIAGYHYMGIVMPAAWTTSATLTFQVSADGTTYQNLYDDSGNEVSLSGSAASKSYSLDSLALKLAPWNYMKIRSGTAASAVNQAAARSITVILKE